VTSLTCNPRDTIDMQSCLWAQDSEKYPDGAGRDRRQIRDWLHRTFAGEEMAAMQEQSTENAVGAAFVPSQPSASCGV